MSFSKNPVKFRWKHRLNVSLMFAVLATFPPSLSAGVDPKSEPIVRPNVILVMADDLGWGDPRCFAPNSPISTPHLDAMCAAGLKFQRFYAASPVCSPTRGSCLTGRHPQRYGIRSANVGHLLAREICLADVLQRRGYSTGHFGKWHLGTLSPDYSGKGASRKPRRNYCTPGMRGFDRWFSTEFAVATWDPYEPENSHLGSRQPYDTRALYWKNGQNVVGPLTGCDSAMIMDEALTFIDERGSKQLPFFAVIWFHAPHLPVISGEADRQAYVGESVDRQHYFGVVSALDAQVGRLRSELRRLGIANDTMVWFCSDNGPEGNPSRRGRSQGSAGPFRGRKRSLYEGGVRVPGIVEWPAVVQPGGVTDEPCVTSDYFDTILAATNIQAESHWPERDGVNLMPLLRGEAFQRQRPIGFWFGSQSSWVERRYKLVHNRKNKRSRSDNGDVPVQEWELYDLLADPSESRNVADRHPEKVVSMREELERWSAPWR